MKKKTKNPLYVVKGKDVSEASGVIDLVIKKLNLEPLVMILQNLLKIVLENVKSYPTLVAVKNFLDEFLVVFMKRTGMV
jgi:hypothetical protein